MNQFEANIVTSFRNAKKDIIEIQNRVVEISKKQEELARLLLDLKGRKPVKTVKPKHVSKKSTKFLAAKEGKKFHILACPYAKNIKPKSKVTFKSKNAALNKGYKPCSCVG